MVSGLTSSLASVTRESPQLEEDRDMEDSLQSRAATRLKSAMVGDEMFYDTVAQTSIVKQVQKYWIKPTVKVYTYHMSTPRCGKGGGQLRWLFDP